LGRNSDDLVGAGRRRPIRECCRAHERNRQESISPQIAQKYPVDIRYLTTETAYQQPGTVATLTERMSWIRTLPLRSTHTDSDVFDARLEGVTTFLLGKIGWLEGRTLSSQPSSARSPLKRIQNVIALQLSFRRGGDRLRVCVD
jgi:hypothetical protein